MKVYIRLFDVVKLYMKLMLTKRREMIMEEAKMDFMSLLIFTEIFILVATFSYFFFIVLFKHGHFPFIEPSTKTKEGDYYI